MAQREVARQGVDPHLCPASAVEPPPRPPFRTVPGWCSLRGAALKAVRGLRMPPHHHHHHRSCTPAPAPLHPAPAPPAAHLLLHGGACLTAHGVAVVVVQCHLCVRVCTCIKEHKENIAQRQYMRRFTDVTSHTCVRVYACVYVCVCVCACVCVRTQGVSVIVREHMGQEHA